MAARSVQMPLAGPVSQMPSPGVLSTASEVSLVVKLKADADCEASNSNRQPVRLLSESRDLMSLMSVIVCFFSTLEPHKIQQIPLESRDN